ncbi:MAG: cytochrome c [Deltaproteobacteria bacterium]|nr:cytochrome c [Deltaproteobacteria bacterium]
MKTQILFAAVVIASITPSRAAAADLEKGKALFAQRCATCHGALGAGDGPVAQSLPPESKPRNLNEGAFKFATDDAKMKELLQKGGAAVGLNPLMPPTVGLSDADLENIIAFVHSLKK